MLFEANFKSNYTVITADSGIIALEKLYLNKEIVVVISDMKMPEMNGIEFITLAKKDFPHIAVVISDMKMPEMNGIEFITRAKKEYPKIAYYILTGYDITLEIADALNTKLINKYFRKPFNLKEIEDAIVEALAKE